MRQETNNEMDLLLRRLGRQQETASGDHLDADELSSYAENVLPPAARARYTQHLAECSRCRDLVVQLSSSAGVVVAQETAKVPAPSALRKFLASLFSPMVLRYAVPALGLVVVAAIGFMVSRNEGTSNSPIADVRYKQQDQAPASQPQQPSSSPDKPSSALFDSGESHSKAVTPHDSAAKSGAAAPPAGTVSPVTTDTSQDTETQAKKIEEQQQPVAKEAPAPPPKPASVVDGLAKLAPEKQKQVVAENRVTAANEPPAEKAADENKREARKAPEAAARAKRAEVGSVVNVQSGAATIERDDTADKDKNDAETRSVAGRRFRRQGSVWVDTAYSSPRNIIDLPRGSERYRSVVADEPEIKRIADQLDGEIIVVWKGQAYKIR